jgi:hypothetical protein
MDRIRRSSSGWIGLYTAALSLLGCAAAPPVAAPTVALIECPAGSSLIGERCVSAAVSCPDGAKWDGATCVGLKRAGEAGGAPEGDQGIVGEYSGDIEINGKAAAVDTRLSAINGVIVGDYVYGPQKTHGRLSGCRVSGRLLSCDWAEPRLSGTLRVELAPDDQAFSGAWIFADGRPGGTWTGRRRGTSAPSASVASSPGSRAPGSISGTYRGMIGINGAPGPVVTELDTSTGRVTGSYTYGTAQGQLSACKLVSRKLSCTWTEGPISGRFHVDFAPDFKSFNGAWDFSDGRPGGTWSGNQ